MKNGKLWAILLYCVINLNIYSAAQISSDLSLNKKKLESVFLTAAYNNNTEIMESCISQGVNINCRDNLGKTALIYTASNNNKKMVQRLIDLKADVNIADYDGLTAVVWASTGFGRNALLQFEIVRLLINAGCNVKKYSSATLYYAVHNPNIIDLLIKNGADVNASTRAYSSSDTLNNAIIYQEIDSINLLIKAGANLNDSLAYAIKKSLEIKDSSFEYMKKFVSNQIRIIRLLIANGAYITTKEIDEYIARNYPSLTDFQKTRLVIIYNLLDRTSRLPDALMDIILDYV